MQASFILPEYAGLTQQAQTVPPADRMQHAADLRGIKSSAKK
jgi:hypothetical protein